MLALITYDGCLFSSLAYTCAAALVLFLAAFRPRFSLITLGNALLLSTVFVPYATNRLTIGTRVGWALWSANFFFFLVLLVRWTVPPNSQQPGLPVLVSLLGLVLYGLHVFVFSAVP
jgi:hypothetical protein